MGMMVHVVRVVMIVVSRANRVIVVVIVGHNHSTILTGRWTTVSWVAWVTIRIITIPHVDSLVIGVGITPCGRSIIDLHLSANRGRRGLFPACGLHALALVLFVDHSPARAVLLHRTRTTPRANTATSSTAIAAAAAAAFLGFGRAPTSLHRAITT